MCIKPRLKATNPIHLPRSWKCDTSGDDVETNCEPALAKRNLSAFREQLCCTDGDCWPEVALMQLKMRKDNKDQERGDSDCNKSVSRNA